MRFNLKETIKTISLSVVAIGAFMVDANAGANLDTIKKRGEILCGVTTGVAGFSIADSNGKWTGFDVDFCKAVASAVFGNANKVKYIPLTSQQRFTALQSGEIDILSRNTTWTMTRDTQLGLVFAGVTFYDGQGFLVEKKLNVKSAKELNGATVCMQTGTTTERNIAEYLNANKVKYKTVAIEEYAALKAAFIEGRCNVYSTDSSALAVLRVNDLKNPDEYVILNDIISKEPLGPAIRRGDDEWFSIVKWTYFALINAEEMNITSANIDTYKTSTLPAYKRFLGIDADFGKSMGVSADWSYQIIKQVGNYGEIYDRNVGKNSPLNIPRGLNRLWNAGGILYAPPIN